MRNEALSVVYAAIKAADPYLNTRNLIRELFSDSEEAIVISLGKAACPMMRAAEEVLGNRIRKGLVVTKYHHSEGFAFRYSDVIESGHPISDGNSILAAQKGLSMVKNLNENDILLVLLSGGGSALFEESKVSPDIQRDITQKLLLRGAAIEEINAVRKRLSVVKGGKFAAAAYPAKVVTVALSDVLSNDKSVIASGITVKDTADLEFLRKTVDKYLTDVSDEIKEIIYSDSSININDGGYHFAGDINILCEAAGKKAEELGFSVHYGDRNLSGEASEEAVRILDSIPDDKGRHCYIFGGETVVTLKGNGRGGRNQEMALCAAIKLRDRKGIAFISVGSDGTDGPTEDAGGFADGESYKRMTEKGIIPENELMNNNSNYALRISGDLITTGPTRTNVNDITMVFTYED